MIECSIYQKLWQTSIREWRNLELIAGIKILLYPIQEYLKIMNRFLWILALTSFQFKAACTNYSFKGKALIQVTTYVPTGQISSCHLPFKLFFPPFLITAPVTPKIHIRCNYHSKQCFLIVYHLIVILIWNFRQRLFH